MARTTSKRVGALWKHEPTGAQKSAFLTGTIDLGVHGEVSVAVFRNDRKTKDSQPDYRIVLSKQRNGATSEAGESDEL